MGKKISIVTPVYNGERFIEKNIKSIINQNYDNYEHIIIDGGSKDNTLEIISKYKGIYPMKVFSEKDNGMYDAIQKGFSIASGNIFAWLNADDTYMPWAFKVMNYVMSQNVKWCTAIPTWQNEEDITYAVGKAYLYNRKWIKMGLYDGRIRRFIQQESTFWSSELWKKVGNIAQYKLAGDFYLWKLLAEYEELYTVRTVIGGFRVHDGQKSQNIDEYYQEIEDIAVRSRIYNKRLLAIKDWYFQKKGKNIIDMPRCVIV